MDDLSSMYFEQMLDCQAFYYSLVFCVSLLLLLRQITTYTVA
jgi:hypothetical protein